MFSTGALILVGVMILILVAVVFGYNTRTGTEIDQHPSDGLSHNGEAAAPQAAGTGRIAGREEGEHDPFDTHGTG